MTNKREDEAQKGRDSRDPRPASLIAALFCALAGVALFVIPNGRTMAIGSAIDPGKPRVVRVADAAQLRSALANARGGEDIRLAPGDYGQLVVQGRKFPTEVRIASETADRPARFTGINIADSSRLTLEGLSSGRPLAGGEANWTELNGISNSQNITFKTVRFHGSPDNDPSNDGYGLFVRNSQGIRVEDSVFTELGKAVMVAAGDDITVVRSKFSTIREDGINTAGVVKLLIDRNQFSDFFPQPGDHPDAIQLYNARQKRGQSDVRITNNVILQGNGRGGQGIWIADPQSFGFQDLVISNNLIEATGWWNGIGVVGATGVVITGNTLISDEGDEKTLWVRLEQSSNVTLKNNVFEALVIGKANSGLSVADNLDLSKAGGSRRKTPKSSAASDISAMVFPGVGYQPPQSQD